MEYARVPLVETWKAMEALTNSGMVRNIGLCNVNTGLLRDLLNQVNIPPAGNGNGDGVWGCGSSLCLFLLLLATVCVTREASGMSEHGKHYLKKHARPNFWISQCSRSSDTPTSSNQT